MKLSLLPHFGLLALVGSSTAQYISEGWTPGQKVQEETATLASVYQPSETASPAQAPTATPFSLSSLLDINKLLTSEPAVSLFDKLGINITERVKAASEAKLWDDRVVLITDDNYKDLIVNEPLTEEEEKKRVWVIVISVTSARNEGVSRLLDDFFDASYDKSIEEGDLPDVRWGRIDYLNVTAITTKWNVWQAPYLVILTDRGQTLRFYRPYQMRLKDDALRAYLKAEGWKQIPPWSSSFAPGGRNEYIMVFLAIWFTKLYNVLVLIPKWLMFILSGGLASLILSLMHRPSKKAAVPGSATTSSAQPATAVSSSSSSKTSGIKSGKAVGSSSIANTDGEQDASASPAKRSSARQRKNKK
ncbi:hypothetical protein D9613_004943 [Agrocybe pediades]|uniref:Uncharacterized protein n=1 Tax=Agrocybe pediades TaxID=84607 RepID=A0A8H4VRH1_9AGAR|nr:hypothetical protein D9613_004943 [Agrocybe pediades]